MKKKVRIYKRDTGKIFRLIRSDGKWNFYMIGKVDRTSYIYHMWRSRDREWSFGYLNRVKTLAKNRGYYVETTRLERLVTLGEIYYEDE